MGRPKRKTPTKRIHVELTQRAHERLLRLRDETESSSLSDTMARALAVYETLWETAGADKGRVLVRDGDTERELVLLF